MATTASGNPIKRFTDSGEADRLSCPTCEAKEGYVVLTIRKRQNRCVFLGKRKYDSKSLPVFF